MFHTQKDVNKGPKNERHGRQPKGYLMLNQSHASEESMSSLGEPGQVFFCRRNNLVFVHSQQLGEGTRTQELGD